MRRRRRAAAAADTRLPLTVVPKRKPGQAISASASAAAASSDPSIPDDEDQSDPSSESDGDDELEFDSEGEVIDVDLRKVWDPRKKRKVIPPPPPPCIPDPAEFKLSPAKQRTMNLRPPETCALRYYLAREHSLLKTLIRHWEHTGYTPDFALSDGLMCIPHGIMQDADYYAFYSLFVYISRPLNAVELQFVAGSYRLMDQAALNGTPIAFCDAPVCNMTDDDATTVVMSIEFSVTYVVAYRIHERRRTFDTILPWLYDRLCEAHPAWTDALGSKHSTIILTLIYGYWSVPYIDTVSDILRLKADYPGEISDLVTALPLSDFPHHVFQ